MSIRDEIHSSVEKIPDSFIIHPVKWKLLYRSILYGKNIMITGPKGTGKTSVVHELAKVMGRPVYSIPLGSTQDPRSTLIGNVHFSKENGTFFSNSMFVEAIQKPNSIILIDEISRSNPEAWNILITPLDVTQRFLRIDEHPDTPTIRVADGVCFIATANIGMQYTATRVLDRALTDRFQILEMDTLTRDQMEELLNKRVPENDKNSVIADIYYDILFESVNSENPKISEEISPRSAIETAELMRDGFTLSEAAMVTMLPYYSSEGGEESERSFVETCIEKYNEYDSDGSNLFNINTHSTN